MGMPLELNTLIVTKGKETRVAENLFSLVKEGYRLYPIDIPIEVRRTIGGELSGTAKIKKVELENNQTTITYELVALHSIN
ncbi:DUF2584 domain-containing protein [Cytobacillus sp. FJAT-54145]|uniref:DUF2584 domain-containing protein n=1 Tax=Cytobacillus spartinae TaxID=3299023 RepID=A0ABW6KGE9_9BACI